MELNICHLYPDILNLYGDRGNILCMRKRLAWRGIDVNVDEVSIGQKLEASKYDLLFIGGGQDFEQEVLLPDLRGAKTEELKAIYPGEKAYRKAVLSVLGRYKAFEADVSIDGGAETHEACTIVEIANGQSIGGGMRVAPDAKLDDGYFDVVVVKKVPRMLIPLLLPAFMLGWHTKIGLARVVRAKNVTMRAKGMIVNLDGKLLRADEAKYKILPGAIRMKKPRA